MLCGHSTPTQEVLGVVLLAVKQQRPQADHSTSFNVKVTLSFFLNELVN
jgi:hypothetical protein